MRQQRGQRLGDGAGLLVDLLEHEVAEAAALDLAGLPVERHHRPLDRAPVGVEHAQARRRDDGHVAVLEVDAAARQGDHRGGVGGDDVLAVAEPDHQRRAVAEGDDGAGVGAR